MTQGLQEVGNHELTIATERVLLPKLADLVRSKDKGHCMKVSDLDLDLMVRLCGSLQAEIPDTQVVILSDSENGRIPAEMIVSSTKLVELRNPLADNSLRPPLLVFVPSNLKASAEASFGVATFEEINVGDIYKEVATTEIQKIPTNLRNSIQEILSWLEQSGWQYADSLAIVRFLLTIQINNCEPAVVGAALFELSLVPDFELLTEPHKALQRVKRNRECVQKLTWSTRSERMRVFELSLADKAFRAKLASFLVESGLEDPTWTRRVVMDRSYWELAFHRWQFEDSGEEADRIHLEITEVKLPIISENETEDHLASYVGQRVLTVGKGGLRSFSVEFRVEPPPVRISNFAKFTAQVISVEHGPVGLVSSKSAWKTSKTDASITFSKLNKVAWEEGWHYVRILPYTDIGDLVPLVDENGELLPWSSDADRQVGTLPNESDLFYVLQDETLDIEPLQRAIQREASLIHAQLRLQFAALLSERDLQSISPSLVNWSKEGNRSQDVIKVTFGREGSVHIPVSRHLKVIEQKILSDPKGAVRWRLPIDLMGAGDATKDAQAWTQDEFTEHFLEARAAYFAAIQAGTKQLISQAADFCVLNPLVIEYASRYQAVLQYYLQQAQITEGSDQQYALSCLRTLLSVDTVSLILTNHRGQYREAALIAPTHPLRALWLTTWAEVGQKWLEIASHSPNEFAIPAREALLRVLAPLNFPPVLSTGSSHLLTAVDNLHPCWTLYAPSDDSDPRGLIGDICIALGLEEPGIGGTLIDGSYLATRVQRYLVQHPYIRTLTINAFNPGRATVLADMLLELQNSRAFADLNYDIRLFVPDPDTPGIGSALVNLLSPNESVSAKEADAFSTPSDNHLYPKLSLAIHRKEEFSQHIDRYPAHLSILFDIFPAQQIGAELPFRKGANAPVYGLFQDFWTSYLEDSETVRWSQQPKHGQALPIEGDELLTQLISELPALMSSAIAAIATNQTLLALRPVITLSLDTKERALIHQVHQVSDWVITVDRNMGIEFFDHGGLKARPNYLIDHSPGMVSKLGHRLVITSRSMTELEAMVLPLLKQYNLPTQTQYASTILDQLRSLSGRLALKLISSPTQQAEVLGLALARLYLAHQGVFNNQVVVPLDTHLELYRVLQRQADELGDEVSFKRTDLALFDLNAASKTITCRLVEVKCYAQIGGLAQFSHLKERIAQQISQSEQVLAYHFDPHRTSVDRPDRLLKTRELATLLEFYLDRGVRYRLIETDVEAEARLLLGAIEDGYHLTFTRSAVIFDFEKPGTEPPESEAGIEYHRIGIDLIRQLLDAAAISETEEQEANTASTSEVIGTTNTERLRRKAASIPVLGSAAFLGEARERSISQEELSSHRTPNSKEISHSQAEQPNQPSEGDVSKSAEADRQVELQPPQQPATDGLPQYDVLLGATSNSPQYGILGEVAGRKVAIDLNQTHTISLFGVQGGGKSYTLGTIAEMVSLQIPQINCLPQPLATVIFHYSPTQDYKPEFTSMAAPNSDEKQIAMLREQYGAAPQALTDVVLLAPDDQLEERLAEYPSIEIHPLKFAASELRASHWRFLMGAIGNQAAYIRQLNRIMKANRNNLSLEAVRQGIDNSSLPDQTKNLAHQRLDLAAEYIDDSVRLSDLIRPGRLVIVDLRDEFIEKDNALGLFVVLLQLFADAQYEGQSFNKLVVFDEAHKYIENSDLLAGLIEVVREMRHKGTSVMIASQDPSSVPLPLIELSSLIILHKFNSPAWLKHTQRANTSLSELTPEKMSQLQAGEAFIWVNKATDDVFSRGTVKVRCRPRVTQHGGATKTATGSN